MDSQKKGFVLSLQDLCKLKILLNVELFPLKSLAQLPQSMRYCIFRILPLFDRLHYDGSPQHDHQFLSDIFQLQDISRPETTGRWYAGEILYGNTDNMKQILVRSLFNESNYKTLAKGCLIDLKEASQFLDCLSSDEDPILTQYVFDYIERCYSCLVISWSNVSQDNADIGVQAGQKPFNNYVVMPSRFEEFLTIDKRTESSRFTIVVHKPQALISYCNLQGIPRLVVNTKHFLRSPLWNLFTQIKEKAIQSSTIKHSADPVPISDKPLVHLSPADDTSTAGNCDQLLSSMVDRRHLPIIINPTCPVIQDILSSVEHLEIISYRNLSSWHLFEKAADFSIDAPSFIMHNIVSQENPSLKSIHVREFIPAAADSFTNLDTVTAFLCGNADGPVVRYRHDDDDKGNEYSFMPPNNKSCFIEKLSINAESEKDNNANCELWHMLERHTASISRNVRKIIKCHESTLDSISLHGDVGFAHKSLIFHDIGFSLHSCLNKLEVINPEEYCSLVQTTFIDFIQFPQFKSLELDDSPDQICHPLVMAYLSTPATHEQYLAISLKPDACPVPKPDLYPGCDILPESNLKYKSLRLNLKGKESHVIKHLLRFPNLSLKSLNVSTRYLSADSALPSTVNIQRFTLNLHDNEFSCSKLDLFICKNPSLTTFIMQDYFRHNGIDILTVALKKVNDCLIRLVKKQATLESIILNDVKLWTNDGWTTVHSSSQQPSPSMHQPSNANCSSDSVDGCGEEYDITQWFSPYFVTEVANRDNIDVIVFFYLVQKLNATLLFAKESMRIFREDLPSHFIPSLVHAEIMIRKVTLNGYFKKWKDEFSKIARVVETD